MGNYGPTCLVAEKKTEPRSNILTNSINTIKKLSTLKKKKNFKKLLGRNLKFKVEFRVELSRGHSDIHLTKNYIISFYRLQG